MLHRTLQRQIKKFIGGEENIPPEWISFFNTISNTYYDFDKDLVLLDRSLELSSEEFLENSRLLQEAKRGVEKIVQERTQELEYEKAMLEKAKANDEAMLASIGDGLVAVDQEGTILMINRTAEGLLGAKNAGFIGKKAYDAFSMYDVKGNIILSEERPIQIALTTGKPIITTTATTTHFYEKKDGTKFPVAITITPVILNKKITGAIEIFRDITKEKEIDRAKSEFVALASHQLRTPATIVRWYSKVLFGKKIGKLNLKQKKYLGEIYYGNERMLKLINNLLNISRIEMGELKINIEPVDIKKMLENVIKGQKTEISKRKQKITVNRSGKLPKIFTDPVLLRIIFQNLISNAVKYNMKNGKIICDMEIIDSKFLFKISDNGIGIPKDEQKRIFERLFRASNSIEQDREGNGLGLYIVKQITGILGGKVWFESELKKRTIFYLELPLKISSK